MTLGMALNQGAACPICSGAMRHSFSAEVLGKYQADYEVCGECGFLRAHDPHWLGEAYSNAIAAADTGLVARNFAVACKLAGVLYWTLGERGQGRYLDAAGGYGMLTRIMRDFGFDFYWADKYCNNILVPGFEYRREDGPCNAVTAIEVFEHLTDPVAFVTETLRAGGAPTMIFTTELYEGEPPRPDDWWYYTFATGQHIGFFTRQTLETLARNVGLRFASSNGIHVLSEQQISESMLRFVTGRWTSRFAPLLTRRMLGSKMMSDHQRMLQKIG